MGIAVVVATFGDQAWIDLAKSRAIPSAEAQAPTFHFHGATLAAARNSGLHHLVDRFEHLIYLDADDELNPGYVDAMAAGTADLRVPRLQQVRRGIRRRPFKPQVWGHNHECSGPCLRQGNFAVIGTCVRSELLREVGGWEEWGWSEDWAAWARCWKESGSLEWIHDAVYCAHVSMDSRNHALPPEETNRWHREIEAAIWPDEEPLAA